MIAADDELDQLEVKIDDEAVRFMNLRAPIASDLRLVIVGMKASHDLERVGDEATSIAKRAIKLSAEPPLKPYIDIPRMTTMALEMLRDALDCFLQVRRGQGRGGVQARRSRSTTSTASSTAS